MGEFEVWVDQYGFICAKIIGSHDQQQAEIIISKMNELIQQKQKTGHLLIDMTKTGRPTSKARKLHAENIKLQSEFFRKAALYGASVLNRVMANFIIKASGKGKKVRYFSTKEEAVKWLNQ